MSPAAAGKPQLDVHLWLSQELQSVGAEGLVLDFDVGTTGGTNVGAVFADYQEECMAVCKV